MNSIPTSKYLAIPFVNVTVLSQWRWLLCEPPDFYLFHFHLICEIRCTLPQISWEPFTGLRWKLYIWVALGLRILLILVSWGKTVYFRKSQIFHLHFFTEEINYFKKVLMRNLLFSHKNRCQVRKPKYNVEYRNNRGSCNPCHDHSNVL